MTASSQVSAPGGLMRSLGTAPRRLYDWVLHWADTPHALVALFVLSFAEASFFPIPPDVLLIAMCLKAPHRTLQFAVVCTVASVLGGALGYAIGLGLWEGLDTVFYRYVPGITPESFAKVQGLYEAWGIPIVFTAGFTPIPFKLFTITSGVMVLPLVPFLAAAAVGRAGRFFLVAILIRIFGAPITRFIDRYFNWLALAFTVLLIGGFLVIKVLV